MPDTSTHRLRGRQGLKWKIGEVALIQQSQRGEHENQKSDTRPHCGLKSSDEEHLIFRGRRFLDVCHHVVIVVKEWFNKINIQVGHSLVCFEPADGT